MLLQPLNELSLTLRLKAIAPLLVKEGRYSQTEKDKYCAQVVQQQVGNRQGREADEQRNRIRARFPGSIPISRNTVGEIEVGLKDDDPLAKLDGLRYYLPGSSIRGAWRSHLERWLRGFAPEDARICDPFQDDAAELFYACSHYLGKRKTPVPAYANSCPVCRLFGNTGQGSRIAISDAERVPNTGRLISREHININRHNQQVKTPPGPFKFFALQDAHFDLKVKIRNFELVQIALVAEGVKGLHEERILLGSGKNKGYGAVSVETFSAKLTHFGMSSPTRQLRGIAEHAACSDAMRTRYGLLAGSPVALPEECQWQPDLPWSWSAQLGYAALMTMSNGIGKQLEGMWPRLGKLSDRPREATA